MIALAETTVGAGGGVGSDAGHTAIRVLPQSFDTIWGGSGLMDMYAACMEYSFAWEWDHLINMSEQVRAASTPVAPLYRCNCLVVPCNSARRNVDKVPGTFSQETPPLDHAS